MSVQNFSRTFRFIDYLNTINNENFEENIQNIDPLDLEFKKENIFNKNARILTKL